MEEHGGHQNQASSEDTSSLLKLLFHTRLIDTVKSVCSTSLDVTQVSKIDWQELIDEARYNIDRYELGCVGNTVPL